MTGSLYGQLGNTPDTNCIDGKIYTNSLQVHYAGDGKINYKFYFKDGWGVKATGEPTNVHPWGGHWFKAGGDYGRIFKNKMSQL